MIGRVNSRGVKSTCVSRTNVASSATPCPVTGPVKPSERNVVVTRRAHIGPFSRVCNSGPNRLRDQDLHVKSRLCCFVLPSSARNEANVIILDISSSHKATYRPGPRAIRRWLARRGPRFFLFVAGTPPNGGGGLPALVGIGIPSRGSDSPRSVR